MVKMENWKAKSKNQDLSHADERNWFTEKVIRIVAQFPPQVTIPLYMGL